MGDERERETDRGNPKWSEPNLGPAPDTLDQRTFCSVFLLFLFLCFLFFSQSAPRCFCCCCCCCPSFFCSVLSRRVSSSVLCFRLALFACNFSALMENIVAYHRKSGEVFFFAPPRTPFCVRTLSVHTDNSNNNNKSSTHEHDFDKINGHINLSQRAPCGSLRLCVINLIKISLAASSFF